MFSIDKLMKAAGISPAHQRAFADKLAIAIIAYRVRLLAHQQGRPAAIVAALKPVLTAAKALQRGCTARRKASLLRRLRALPDGLRFDLRAGGLEQSLRLRGADSQLGARLAELVERSEARQGRAQGKIGKGAPVGSATIGAAFRESVLMIFEQYRPDASEAQWRAWTGDVWAKIGDAILDPKKHAKLFKAGFVARKAKRGP